MQENWKKIYIPLAIILLAVFSVLFFMSGDYLIFENFFKIIANSWWIIFPIPLWIIFREVWTEYTELKFIVSQDSILLEIKPPADTEKSPKIMEQVFAGLHSWSTPNRLEVYCGWRPMQDKFTFELVSINGEVHFLVKCPKAARNNIEAQIYAQYPDAEIFEAEDYLNKLPKNVPNKEWNLWGTVLDLYSDDCFPIRTYKYFKEDVTGNMIDPLASMAEVMSNLGGGQNVLFQVVFTPAAEKEWHPQSLEKIDEIIGRSKDKGSSYFDNLVNGLQEVFLNVFKAFSGKEPEFSSDAQKEEKEFNINQLTPGKQEQVRAIEENISKPGFRTTIRLIYLGKRENFNKAVGVAGVMGSIKQFSDINLNSLIPDNRTKTFANYFMTESRMLYRQRKIYQDYRDRAFAGTGFIFNTEELASIYHFPDMSVKTPAIQKIEAKKGEAPSNLPISAETAFE